MDNESTDHSNYDMKKNIQERENTSCFSFWGFTEEEFLTLKNALETSVKNETESQTKFLNSSQELKENLSFDTVRLKSQNFILEGAKDTVSNRVPDMSCCMPELAGIEVRTGSKSCSVSEPSQTTDSLKSVANQEQFVGIDKKAVYSTNKFWDIPRNILSGNNASNVHDEILTGCLTESEETRLKNEDDMFTSRITRALGDKKLNLHSLSDKRLYSDYSENYLDYKIGKRCRNSADEEIIHYSTLAESSDESYKSATSYLSESDSETDIPISRTVATCLSNGSENHMPDSDFYSTKDVTAIFSENETNVSLEKCKLFNDVPKNLNNGTLYKSRKNAAEKNTTLQNNKDEIKLLSSDEEMALFYLDTALDTEDDKCCLNEDNNETEVFYKSSNVNNKSSEKYHKHAALRDVVLNNIKTKNTTEIDSHPDEEMLLNKFNRESEKVNTSQIKQKCEDQEEIPSNAEIIFCHVDAKFKDITQPKVNQQYEDQINTPLDEEISTQLDKELETTTKTRQKYENQTEIPSNEEIISNLFYTEFEEVTFPKVNQQYKLSPDEKITPNKYDTKFAEIVSLKITRTYENQTEIVSNEYITCSQLHTKFEEDNSWKGNKQSKVTEDISSSEEIRSSQSDIESEEVTSLKISQLYDDQVNIPTEEKIKSIKFDTAAKEISPVKLKKQYDEQLHIPSSAKITINQFDGKSPKITPRKIRQQYENIVKVDKSLDEDTISSHSDVESESNSESSSSEVEIKSRLKILQTFRRKSVQAKRRLKILHQNRFIRKPYFQKSGDKKLLKCVCVSLKLSKKGFKRKKKVSETSISDDGTFTEITSEERSPTFSENSFEEGIRANVAQVNMNEALDALLLMPTYLEKLESLNLVPVYNMKIEKSRLFHRIIEKEADESFDSNVFDDDESDVEDIVIVSDVVKDERKNYLDARSFDASIALPLSENLQLEENESKTKADGNPKKVKKKVRFKLDEEVMAEKSDAKGKGCFPFMYLFPSH